MATRSWVAAMAELSNEEMAPPPIRFGHRATPLFAAAVAPDKPAGGAAPFA